MVGLIVFFDLKTIIEKLNSFSYLSKITYKKRQCLNRNKGRGVQAEIYLVILV